MLVSAKEMLQKARDGKYAVGQFNINNLEWTKAILLTVVLAPLVPWSIAGAVPLAAVGAPIASVVVASYLYILPIWSFLVRLIRRS